MMLQRKARLAPLLTTAITIRKVGETDKKPLCLKFQLSNCEQLLLLFEILRWSFSAVQCGLDWRWERKAC